MYKFKLIIIALLLVGNTAFADIPKTLNYQGRLMNATGQPVIDGQYTVKFRLYTAVEGGNMVWEEAQSVMSNNGYFNTVLGNSKVLNLSIFDQPLWLGIQVGAEAEMTPRSLLGTSAYAMNVADGAITTGKIVDGAVTADKIAVGAVIESKIADESITNDKIAGGAISTKKIENNAITKIWSYKRDDLIDHTKDETIVIFDENIEMAESGTVLIMATAKLDSYSSTNARAYWEMYIDGEFAGFATETVPTPWTDASSTALGAKELSKGMHRVELKVKTLSGSIYSYKTNTYKMIVIATYR
jgi:hypothetical protein